MKPSQTQLFRPKMLPRGYQVFSESSLNPSSASPNARQQEYQHRERHVTSIWLSLQKRTSPRFTASLNPARKAALFSHSLCFDHAASWSSGTDLRAFKKRLASVSSTGRACPLAGLKNKHFFRLSRLPRCSRLMRACSLMVDEKNCALAALGCGRLLVPWSRANMIPWYRSTMAPWHHGTLLPWYHGTTIPWDSGTTLKTSTNFRIIARAEGFQEAFRPGNYSEVRASFGGKQLSQRRGGLLHSTAGKLKSEALPAQDPTLVPWYHGDMTSQSKDAMLQLHCGTMVPRATIPWYRGSTAPSPHNTKVRWHDGTMVPSQPRTLDLAADKPQNHLKIIKKKTQRQAQNRTTALRQHGGATRGARGTRINGSQKLPNWSSTSQPLNAELGLPRCCESCLPPKSHELPSHCQGGSFHHVSGGRTMAYALMVDKKELCAGSPGTKSPTNSLADASLSRTSLLEQRLAAVAALLRLLLAPVAAARHPYTTRNLNHHRMQLHGGWQNANQAHPGSHQTSMLLVQDFGSWPSSLQAQLQALRKRTFA